MSVLVVAWFAVSPLRSADDYHFLKEIPIGGDGGWDYISVDPASHRLFVSHSTQIVVVDTTRDAVVGTIADTPGVHGIAVAPTLNRGYTSNGRADTVGMVDLQTLKTLGTVPTGHNPDSILFEPAHQEVYAFNGRDQSATVIGAATGKVVTTIELGGKPEFAVVDPGAGLVYDNLEDRNEVAVIDPKTHAVVHRWPIAPGESASGLAIDLVHHRLFLGCDNAMMIVMDSRDGQVVASVPAGAGIDGAAFDPGTGLAFTSNGRDGTVTIVHEDSPTSFRVVQTLETERGARTMAVDPGTHKIYLPTARFEPPAPGTAGEHHWPTIVPGTFKVLVYGT